MRGLPLLLALSCLPAPLDVEGKLCSVDRGCGPGYYCFQSSCLPGTAPAPTNQLANPDFEQLADAGIPHWHPSGLGRLSSESLLVHDGGWAARVTSINLDGGLNARLSGDSVLDAGAFTWCGTIWVYGIDAGSAHVVLTLTARYDGGLVTQNGSSQSVPLSPAWQQLKATVDTNNPDSLGFTVSTSAFPAGEQMLVDDGWLWQPIDGQCP